MAEAPNTLQSRSVVRITDVISEGEIEGLVNGKASIFFDETPLIDADTGQVNFDVEFEIDRGEPNKVAGRAADRWVGASTPSLENEVSVNVEVTKDNPKGSGSGDGSVTRTISDTTLNEVRLKLRVPSLVEQVEATGEIKGAQLNYEIYLKESGGSFALVGGSNSVEYDWMGDAFTPARTDFIEIDVTLPAVAAHYCLLYRESGGTWAIINGGCADLRNPNPGWGGLGGIHGVVAETRRKMGGRVPIGGPYEIYIGRATGPSTWVDVTSSSTIHTKVCRYSGGQTIKGKTTSPYEIEHIIPLTEGTGPWDIKVVKTTNDSTLSTLQNDLYWGTYTEVIKDILLYRDIAYANLVFDAEKTGQQIPKRSYEIYGIKIQVPDNYDPWNRVYTGSWGGTFKTDWTDNPAWIFYDLLTNNRYGLGEYIPAESIDKWSLYTIAKYCDELVPSIDGGEEPRFTCNCVINSQSEAFDVLQAIVSAFRGMCYWSAGSIVPVADMPADPVKIVNQANVINGEFHYSGTALKSRHTAVAVAWNDASMGFRQSVEIVSDREAIATFGYRKKDVTAFGCATRSQAVRFGKWILETEKYEGEMVTYKASFDHMDVMPGDIILVADSHYAAVRHAGRCASGSTTTSVKLDSSVTLAAGVPYTLSVTLPDGTLEEVEVTSAAGTHSTLAVDALTYAPIANATWALTGAVTPRQFRVMAIVEREKHIFEVTAAFHDPNKFDRVEQNLNVDAPVYRMVETGPLGSPSNVTIQEFLYYSGSSIMEGVEISWQRPDDSRARLFEIEILEPNEPAWTPVGQSGVTSIRRFDTPPGVYSFRVRSLSEGSGLKSAWVNLDDQTLLGKMKPPADVTGYTATRQKYGIRHKWTEVHELDIDYYEIRVGADWATGTTIFKGKDTDFLQDTPEAGSYDFFLKAVDTSENESDNEATASATIADPATPSVASTAINGGIAINITHSQSIEFSHYVIERRLNGGGSETTIDGLVKSKNWADSDIATLGYSNSYQYRVTAYDRNGSAGTPSDWTTARTPKLIQTLDITTDQIIGKDFRTACNAGNGTVSGVKMDSLGLEGWNGANRKFCVSAATGIMCAVDGVFSGTVTATTGTIAGWTICSDSLQKCNATLHSGGYLLLGSSNDIVRVDAVDATYRLWAGHATAASAPFRVTKAGAVTATNATITGTVCACSGNIGGWTLGNGCILGGNAGLYSAGFLLLGTGNDVARVDACDATYRLWVGHATAGSAPFSVTKAGAVTATSGTVGGWTLAATSLAGGGITISSTGYITTFVSATCTATMHSTYGFYAGCSTPASAPFCVGPSGSLRATSGNIGGWVLNPAYICSGTTILCCTGLMTGGGFATGNKGWRIDATGNAEFNSAVIRGEMRASLFSYDDISAIGGQALIVPAGQVLTCVTSPAAAGTAFNLDIKDPESGHVQLFGVGDILRVKTWNGTSIADVWGAVASVTNCTTYYRYAVTLCSGTSAVIPANTAVVSYGTAAAGGGIMLAGQGTCAPYIDIFQTGATPWAGVTSQVRIGQLSGTPAGAGWGLWTCNASFSGGILQSSNWAATCGACINLNTGAFSFGGECVGSLSCYASGMKWDGNRITIGGTIPLTVFSLGCLVCATPRIALNDCLQNYIGEIGFLSSSNYNFWIKAREANCIIFDVGGCVSSSARTIINQYGGLTTGCITCDCAKTCHGLYVAGPYSGSGVSHIALQDTARATTAACTMIRGLDSAGTQTWAVGQAPNAGFLWMNCVDNLYFGTGNATRLCLTNTLATLCTCLDVNCNINAFCGFGLYGVIAACAARTQIGRIQGYVSGFNLNYESYIGLQTGSCPTVNYNYAGIGWWASAYNGGGSLALYTGCVDGGAGTPKRAIEIDHMQTITFCSGGSKSACFTSTLATLCTPLCVIGDAYFRNQAVSIGKGFLHCGWACRAQLHLSPGSDNPSEILFYSDGNGCSLDHIRWGLTARNSSESYNFCFLRRQGGLWNVVYAVNNATGLFTLCTPLCVIGALCGNGLAYLGTTAADAQVLTLASTHATPTNVRIRFYGKNSAGTEVMYGIIGNNVECTAAGCHRANFTLQPANGAGATPVALLVNSSGNTSLHSSDCAGSTYRLWVGGATYVCSAGTAICGVSSTVGAAFSACVALAAGSTCATGWSGQFNAGNFGVVLSATSNCFLVCNLGTGTGTAVVLNAGGCLLCSSSSIHHKMNVATLAECPWSLLRPVSFAFRSMPSVCRYGLIAQDVADATPWLVNRDNKGEPISVDYDGVATVALAGVKALESAHKVAVECLNSMESRLAALESLLANPS